MSQDGVSEAYIGPPRARVEDADLLTGRGRFGDDLAMRVGTLHAAILRSPYAHAEVLSVDIEAALAVPRVAAIVTGDDARCWTRPFTSAVKAPAEHRCLVVDRVRYVGEPVAVVPAGDRICRTAAAIRRSDATLPPESGGVFRRSRLPGTPSAIAMTGCIANGPRKLAVTS
jgi:2-furoyl-CoA dehydrogenase large subunit